MWEEIGPGTLLVAALRTPGQLIVAPGALEPASASPQQPREQTQLRVGGRPKVVQAEAPAAREARPVLRVLLLGLAGVVVVVEAALEEIVRHVAHAAAAAVPAGGCARARSGARARRVPLLRAPGAHTYVGGG